MNELILKNAQLVLGDEVVSGHVSVRDGLIADISAGDTALPGADLEGDFLVPGLVELHTDNLEKHVTPRPGVVWPMHSAVLAHDAQVAAAGITTVFDAIALGDVLPVSFRTENLTAMADGIEAAAAAGILRAEHFLHLRCEVCYPTLPDLLAELIDRPIVRFASIMDHTPGQRQFVSMEAYAGYYQVKYNLSDTEFAAFVEQRCNEQKLYAEKHRRFTVDACHSRVIPLASHDDATADHVVEAERDGLVIAEFPTTLAAAEASGVAGMGVMMGAPNLIRGGSHSGNVSARDLAARGLVDILSSDYVPASLLPAAFLMAEVVDGIDLPRAIRTVATDPAARVGLSDRGEIAIGKRADLVRVRNLPVGPVVRTVWREGDRVI